MPHRAPRPAHPPLAPGVEGFFNAPPRPRTPSIVKRIGRQLRQGGGELFQCPIASPHTLHCEALRLRHLLTTPLRLLLSASLRFRLLCAGLSELTHG
eukprot:gene10045-biopygen8937